MSGVLGPLGKAGLWSRLIAIVVLGVGWSPTGAQQYALTFSKSGTRMSWNHRLPSWNYSVPVRLSSGDAGSMLRISTSASMNFTLDQRSERNTWQDNASVNTSINYPILGPKASIGIGAMMSVRNATLSNQSIRNQSFNFNFQYRPLQQGRFRSMQVNVTPGLITASRASRALLGSMEERGVQYNASLRVSPEIRVAGRRLTHSISLGKRDNTLKSNKNRSENFSSSLGYTWPGALRTNLNISESRSEVGILRSVIDERVVDGVVVRDTVVAVETQETRNTSLSSSADFKVQGFDVKVSTSYGNNLRTNTASADEDSRNNYFGKDRENKRWSFDSSISGKLMNALIGRSSLRINVSDERFLSVRLSSGRVFRDPSSDLLSRSLFLNGGLDWQMAERHSLKLSSWVDAKRAANPGAPEQDQDTYSSSVNLAYEGATPSGARVTVGLENKYSHRVNLHATRASDNSRNRDLGLRIATHYERLKINFSHNFTISARRTIYDFDRQIYPEEASRKSNIRRGWSMVHAVRRPFFDHLQLNARYTYTAGDFGKLLIEYGAQVVEEDNGDHNLSFGMSYSPGTTFSTSVNYAYRLNRHWQYQYVDFQEYRFLARRNEHQNLSLTLNYNPGAKTRLSMRGSRSRQRSGTFDSFNVTYSRTM